jgi:hypothetical protein
MPDEAKGGETISVPLNDEAMAVLNEERTKLPEHVFTCRDRPLGSLNTRSWLNAELMVERYAHFATIQTGRIGRRKADE